jgi:hypothetical protein
MLCVWELLFSNVSWENWTLSVLLLPIGVMPVVWTEIGVVLSNGLLIQYLLMSRRPRVDPSPVPACANPTPSMAALQRPPPPPVSVDLQVHCSQPSLAFDCWASSSLPHRRREPRTCEPASAIRMWWFDYSVLQLCTVLLLSWIHLFPQFMLALGEIPAAFHWVRLFLRCCFREIGCSGEMVKTGSLGEVQPLMSIQLASRDQASKVNSVAFPIPFSWFRLLQKILCSFTSMEQRNNFDVPWTIAFEPWWSLFQFSSETSLRGLTFFL